MVQAQGHGDIGRPPGGGGAPQSLLERLQAQGALQPEGLDGDLVELAHRDERALGEALIRKGVVLREDLLRAWGEMLGLPFWPVLQPDGINGEILAKIPIHFARKHLVVPVRLDEDELWVAVSDPFNLEAVDDLRVRMGMEVRPGLSLEAEISRTINRLYQESGDTAEQVLADMGNVGEGRALPELEESEDLLESSTDAPVIKLVNTVLSQAVRARASDIHIEPYHRDLKIRYRVDGVLYNAITPSRNLHSAIVSRIKVMAKMNIAEKRLPQDGRIRLKVADRDFDIRVSTLPTSFGERVVLRLLDKTSVLLGLEEVGLMGEQMEVFERLISAPNGIILVTGPTGSGKTTTLYTALRRLSKDDVNITTIEDPIEMVFDRINQTAVNPACDVTFATALRTILRQDPDIIMVGEIRDLETAQHAIQAALTGHLVLSTLHTNDAPSAITRLLDLGAQHFLVASTVLGIVAQRLMKVICPNCAAERGLTEEERRALGVPLRAKGPITVKFGEGCMDCRMTGYRGRTGIYEVFEVSDAVRELIREQADSVQIKAQARKEGMVTLREAAVAKMLEGTSSFEEVLRVTSEK
jgi:general secretion pathway protein E